MMITGCRSFLLMLLVCCSTSSLWAVLHTKNNRMLSSVVNHGAIKEKPVASVVVSPKKRFAFIKNGFFFIRNFLGLSLVWRAIMPSRRRIFGYKRTSVIEFFIWVTACCNSALLVYAYQKQGSAKGVTEMIARLVESLLQRPVVANPLVQPPHQNSGSGLLPSSQDEKKPVTKPVGVPAAAPVGFDLWTD